MKCAICNKEFKSISFSHLRLHNISIVEYTKRYGNTFSEAQLKYQKSHKGNNKGSCRVKHSFFKHKSNNMYYILGLLYADGSITRNRASYVVQLSLDSKDKELINSIAKVLSFKKKIYTSTDKRYGSSMTSIQIYSEEMFSDLIELGCCERKSNSLVYPNIPIEYKKYFIRGYFDGDGSIFYNAKGHVELSFVCGVRQYLEDLKKDIVSILSYIGISKTYKKDGNCYFIRISNKDALLFLDWMYSGDLELYMKRKYFKYKFYKRSKI